MRINSELCSLKTSPARIRSPSQAHNESDEHSDRSASPRLHRESLLYDRRTSQSPASHESTPGGSATHRTHLATLVTHPASVVLNGTADNTFAPEPDSWISDLKMLEDPAFAEPALDLIHHPLPVFAVGGCRSEQRRRIDAALPASTNATWTFSSSLGAGPTSTPRTSSSRPSSARSLGCILFDGQKQCIIA
ncbi:hypothetical protein VTO73DRAFT_1644 [Trametes versicolor]